MQKGAARSPSPARGDRARQALVQLRQFGLGNLAVDHVARQRVSKAILRGFRVGAVDELQGREALHRGTAPVDRGLERVGQHVDVEAAPEQRRAHQEFAILGRATGQPLADDRVERNR
jgi:hypothetical protein